ncbi:hypothetical protein LSH36_125g04004 [Paralvinella palmiformis]|uniref:Exocyst complex component Sec3 PIP2-binding N-terminal domain-containing protein n=1 Tax=Paralvinella palmiformis TaxID=53620 RepID=A0AAD9JXL5_9ANNE|nr:hypothetical protein LSH36_125g04004 [Paralvinella palmiformis]
MTTIKHTLQRDVFLPNQERLIAVLHVTKTGKKRKASFICAAVTTQKPIQAFIYEVKKSERGESYKKKLCWALRELRVFDAKYVSGKLCSTDSNESTETDKSVQQVEDIALSQDSDWHALTPREEKDLETLMAQCDFAISNAELFAEQLSKDLSVLDGSVKELMETMKDKDMLIQIRNRNHHKLLSQLDSLINQLDMKPEHMTALLNADLSNGRSVRLCTEAANCLLRAMRADIHPGM